MVETDVDCDGRILEPYVGCPDDDPASECNLFTSSEKGNEQVDSLSDDEQKFAYDSQSPETPLKDAEMICQNDDEKDILMWARHQQEKGLNPLEKISELEQQVEEMDHLDNLWY